MSQKFPLNPAQTLAVEHDHGPALVIAGAGSGKTRVLTARVARLLERGVPARAILAFTFTNRAAREMRGRIESTVGPVARELWVGTFHATALRLLRREARTLGISPSFTIYDRADQESILKDILRTLALSDVGYKLGVVLGRISDAKNSLVTPDDFARTAMSPFDVNIAECFRRYQAALRKAEALDFDDLIAESVRLFLGFPEAGARWSRRFEHVLVDEYQDTNHAQFRLVQALAAVHGNLFVVGDDDQSIYGWRGADLANVLEFERNFPGAVTVRLEQNYRSTNNILDAANAVIANNTARKGKTLWSEREAGALLIFSLCADETEEARRIRRHLEAQVRKGRKLIDCAVLYRTNAQSRALETELRQAGMPYEIVGGISFFQRREVKDLLAYLRLVVNPADTASFFRIWNTPRRGFGPAVEAQVQARLARGAADPLEALRSLSREGMLRGAAKAGAEALLSLLDELRVMREQPVDQLFARLLEKSNYLQHLDAANEQDLMDRRANIEELGVSAVQFAGAGRGGALDYLSECSLLTDADRVSENSDRVLLLTVHNAKGLEFDSVVIAGLEEGLLPHGSSLDDTDRLEEERRLFYVAMTRARDEVLLTAAAYRRRFDGAWGAPVSRFVDEVPEHLLQRESIGGARSSSAGGRGGMNRGTGRPVEDPRWNRARGSGDAPAAKRFVETRFGDGRGYQRDEVSDISLDPDDGPRRPSQGITVPTRSAASRKALGQVVYHDKFGRGTVLEAEGEGPDMKLTVRFASAVKKVLARFVSGGADVDR
ncbi:MAG: UvrD-helicase domain-containing protein [Candidatus Eisenbacteria bacterium]